MSLYNKNILKTLLQQLEARTSSGTLSTKDEDLFYRTIGNPFVQKIIVEDSELKALMDNILENLLLGLHNSIASSNTANAERIYRAIGVTPVMAKYIASNQTLSSYVANSAYNDVVPFVSLPHQLYLDSKIFIGEMEKTSISIGRLLAYLVGLESVNYSDMDAVASDATAREAIRNSEEAWNIMLQSSIAVAKYAAAEVGLDPTAYADMTALANDETAMNAIASSETAMDAIANSETAMNAIASSETAMNAIASSEIAMNAIASSEIAMDAVIDSNIAISSIQNYPNVAEKTLAKRCAEVAGQDPADFNTASDIWSNNTVRQAMWAKSSLRKVAWIIWDQKFASLINDESPLNADTSAGYLTNSAWTNSSTVGWQTQVSIDDGKKYIAMVHFYSKTESDWYHARISNCDGTNAIQIDGGSYQARYGSHSTNNGLKIQFYDNSFQANTYSYARSWYICIDD